jgi:hypothetical protein
MNHDELVNNGIEHLRHFRDDVPAASAATKRRIHAVAAQGTKRGPAWLPGSAIRQIGARDRKPASRHVRGRRLLVACAAVVLTGAGAAIVVLGTASGGTGVSNLLTQVRTSFGDGRLLSASVSGATLTVAVAAPDEPSSVSADFEAQMLAADARDTLSTSTPINYVRYTDASGAPIIGQGGDPVGDDPKIAGLASGACNAAARALVAAFAGQSAGSLRAESVLTLPYDGGSCAFTFQTSDPEGFAEAAPFVMGSLGQAMGAPNDRAFLLEVDDEAGAPQFVASSSSSAGGTVYIKPGLSQAFAGPGSGPVGPPSHGGHPVPTGASSGGAPR